MNKMMKSVLWMILALLLPMTQAWAGTGGGSTTTYYAALKAQVSSNSSGMGTVYAGTSQTAGTYSSPTSTSSSQSSTTKDADKTFYAFAKANDGYEFKGWSASDNGTDLGTTSPLAQKVLCSSTSSGSPTTKTLYATFAKIVLPEFAVQFESATGGSYTVDDAVPENRSGLTEAWKMSLFAIPSAGYRLYGWYTLSGDTKTYFAYTATADYTALEATTIGVDFIAESEVAKVTDLDGLKTALAGSSPVVEIGSTATVVVPVGETLTVPAGKKLTVVGKLGVAGTLTVDGMVDGSGKVLKVVWDISQGDVNEPVIAGGSPAPASPVKSIVRKYCKTKVSAVKSNIPTIGLSQTPSYGVLLNGGVFEISKENPKALKVTFASEAVNRLASIVGVTDEIKDNSNYLLLADCSISGPLDGSSRVTFSGIVDCAGKTASCSPSKIAASNAVFLNGTVSLSPSSENQNSKATFINCSSVTIKKIKNSSPAYAFYDCGTMSAPATVSFAYYDSTRTTNFRHAYFYSGVYKYTFATKDDTGMCHVYGGSYNKDPTAYLETTSAAPDGLEARGPTDGYYTVYPKQPSVMLVKIGDAEYETLQSAVMAASFGARLVLQGANELDGKITISADKKLTIDLNGFNISGGSIENAGALRFEDNSTQLLKGTLSSPVTNNDSGTIDVTYGTYSGTFTVNGGTLTTHDGTFATTFAAVENGGVVLLKGGTYAGTIAVPEGYKVDDGRLGEVNRGDITLNNPISSASADYSYTVRGLPGDDCSLYSGYMQGKGSRDDYTDAEWDRLAELRSSIEPIASRAFDATLVFSRPVAAETVSGVAKIMGITRSQPLDRELAANEEYHILIPMINSNGYTEETYKVMFSGEDNGVWSSLNCGIKNNSLANIGVRCTLKFQLRNRVRASDYTSQNQHYNDTFYDIASDTQQFTGKGAIFGETDYTSLAAALADATDHGTVKLSKNCSENVTVAKPCTIDFNDFAFMGTITGENNYGIEWIKTGGEVTGCVVHPPQTVDISMDDKSETSITVNGGWIAEKVGAEATAAEIVEKLETVDVNGFKGWQNYVMGVDGAVADNVLEPVEAVATAEEKKDMAEPVVIAAAFEPDNASSAANSKIHVAYQLFKGTMGASGIVWAAEPVAEADTPRFALDMKDTSGDTYWKIKVVFTAVK